MNIAGNADIIQKCEYVWTIKYSKTNNRQMIRLDSPPFSAKNDDDLKWHLSYISLSISSANSPYLSLTAISPLISEEILTSAVIGGELALSFDCNTSAKYSLTRTFLLDESAPKYNNGRVVLSDVFFKERFNSDVKVNCEITYFNLFPSIPQFISYAQCKTIVPKVNVRVSNPLEGLGKFYLNEEHADVTICIIKSEGGTSKEYPAHKIVLSAHSKLFEAMFSHDMKENRLNRVVVEDIKEEVFLEALRYIYTGNIENLDTLVYELLPVADKYDLEKLKITCENVLGYQLSVDTSMKIVMLADVYNCGDLKKKAVQFIKDHSYDVIEKMDSKAWDDLMSRPPLMKDLIVLFAKTN